MGIYMGDGNLTQFEQKRKPGLSPAMPNLTSERRDDGTGSSTKTNAWENGAAEAIGRKMHAVFACSIEDVEKLVKGIKETHSIPEDIQEYILARGREEGRGKLLTALASNPNISRATQLGILKARKKGALRALAENTRSRKIQMAFYEAGIRSPEWGDFLVTMISSNQGLQGSVRTILFDAKVGERVKSEKIRKALVENMHRFGRGGPDDKEEDESPPFQLRRSQASGIAYARNPVANGSGLASGIKKEGRELDKLPASGTSPCESASRVSSARPDSLSPNSPAAVLPGAVGTRAPTIRLNKNGGMIPGTLFDDPAFLKKIAQALRDGNSTPILSIPTNSTKKVELKVKGEDAPYKINMFAVLMRMKAREIANVKSLSEARSHLHQLLNYGDKESSEGSSKVVTSSWKIPFELLRDPKFLIEAARQLEKALGKSISEIGVLNLEKVRMEWDGVYYEINTNKILSRISTRNLSEGKTLRSAKAYLVGLLKTEKAGPSPQIETPEVVTAQRKVTGKEIPARLFENHVFLKKVAKALEDVCSRPLLDIPTGDRSKAEVEYEGSTYKIDMNMFTARAVRNNLGGVRTFAEARTYLNQMLISDDDFGPVDEVRIPEIRIDQTRKNPEELTRSALNAFRKVKVEEELKGIVRELGNQKV